MTIEYIIGKRPLSKETNKLIEEWVRKCRNKPCINCGKNDFFSSCSLASPIDGSSRVEVICENCNHIMYYRLSKELIEIIKKG